MRGVDAQKNVPAEQSAPPEEAWVPRPHENREGASGPQTTTREGSEAIDGVAAARAVEPDTRAPGERLTPDDRLHRRRDFEAAYKRGARVPGRSFILFILPNEAGRCRLGVTLSRKVGGAVARNRSRRRMREIFRKHRTELGGAFDLVIHARPGIAARDYDELRAEFLAGARRFRAEQRKRG